MNEGVIMRQQLEANPDDDALACALVDYRAELLNIDPTLVRVDVELMRSAAREEKLMRDAAALLQRGTRTRLIVHQYLRWCGHLPARAPMTVVLTRGNTTTFHTPAGVPAGSVYWPTTTVTVAAADVLRVCGFHRPTDTKFLRSRLPKRMRTA